MKLSSIKKLLDKNNIKYKIIDKNNKDVDLVPDNGKDALYIDVMPMYCIYVFEDHISYIIHVPNKESNKATIEHIDVFIRNSKDILSAIQNFKNFTYASYLLIERAIRISAGVAMKVDSMMDLIKNDSNNKKELLN